MVKVLCKQSSDQCVGESRAIRVIGSDIFKFANIKVSLQYKLHAFSILYRFTKLKMLLGKGFTYVRRDTAVRRIIGVRI